ncbi:glutathione S-transferase family protein [Rhizobium leguminosarum]|uniref:glutathione S-transferase family protein n=1 Tax=Rhizobium leguminosarum TaxID=384 RepID=UPI003F9960C6
MITLYAADSPNVLKIFLALEETALPYRAIPIDVMAGAQFDPAFRDISPNAKVPVIVDEGSPGSEPVTVFESGAILIYLAEKTGDFLPHNESARSEAIQWLMLQLSSIGPMLGQFIHFFRFAPPGNDYALARYRTQVFQLLDVIETRLGQSEWIGGKDYSIADMATFPWARPLPRVFGPAIEKGYPKLMEWAARIADRPATVRAYAAGEDIAKRTTSPEKGVPQTLDRVFGRGDFARV